MNGFHRNNILTGRIDPIQMKSDCFQAPKVDITGQTSFYIKNENLQNNEIPKMNMQKKRKNKK